MVYYDLRFMYPSSLPVFMCETFKGINRLTKVLLLVITLVSCLLPFIDTGTEIVLGEDIHFPFFWEQGRLVHTGKGAGGCHVAVYGLVENRGDEKLKYLRFLHPGKIAKVNDLSNKWLPPNVAPDEHWRKKIVDKMSKDMPVLSVQFPYPQGHYFLRGGPKSNKHIGTVAKCKGFDNIYPPNLLEKEDFDFKEVFQKGDLIFSEDEKLVETVDKKLFIQLGQLATTELVCAIDLDPGEARFIAYDIFAPDRAIRLADDVCQWNAYGPDCFISRLATEVKKMAAYSKDFDAKADSILRHAQLVNRVRNGMCSIGKFWVSILYEGRYFSTTSMQPLSVYYHTGDSDKEEYRSKTWIFDDMEFYIITTVFALPRTKIGIKEKELE
jgi:hypothetical protein